MQNLWDDSKKPTLLSQFIQAVNTKATYTKEPIILVCLDRPKNLKWLMDVKAKPIIITTFPLETPALETYSTLQLEKIWTPTRFPPKYQTTTSLKALLQNSQEVYHLHQQFQKKFKPLGMYTTRWDVLDPCTSNPNSEFLDIPLPTLDIVSAMVDIT